MSFHSPDLRPSPSPPAGDPRWRHAHNLWRGWLGLRPRPPLDRWLRREMATRRYGSRDRRRYRDILFAAARFAELGEFLCRQAREQRPQSAAEHDWQHAMEQFAALSTPRSLAAALADDASLTLFFAVIRRHALPRDLPPQRDEPPSAAPLLAAFAGWAATAAAPDDSGIPGPAQLLLAGFPLAWRDQLAARARLSGWDPATTRAFIAAHARRPPLWLHCFDCRDPFEPPTPPPAPPDAPNPARALFAQLSAQFPGARLHPSGAIAIPAGPSLGALTAIKRGSAIAQDLASQKLAALLAPPRGALVWDVCAGAGGKTLNLAARVGPRGHLLATDPRRSALQELRRRARAIGLGNIATAQWRAPAPLSVPQPLRRSLVSPALFDWILLDAPCGGSGTWRRAPDAPLRSSPADLAVLRKRQYKILAAAARHLAPGGRLVYGTCSFTPTENEELIREFCARNPEIQLLRQELLGSPAEDSDTLFGALLERRLDA